MSETIVKSLFTILAAVISGVCLLRTTQMEYVQKKQRAHWFFDEYLYACGKAIANYANNKEEYYATYMRYPRSICGQYLMANNSLDIQKLIDASALKPKGKSKFENKNRYESGRVILQDQFLLLAFAKLDKVGKGILTREEYIDSLSLLWEEIDNYYGQQDVCIPILGSGTTRIGDNEITQQELLNIIIDSYKLSAHKIKKPYKLRIICKKADGFSINNVEAIQ